MSLRANDSPCAIRIDITAGVTIESPMMSIRSWDVFLSHASEDKAAVARLLARKLRQYGFRVWFDEFAISPGESISQAIDNGLAHSQYGLIVVSKAFMRGRWTKDEVAGLRAGARRLIPVWYDVTREQVFAWSPIVADLLAVHWTPHSPDDILPQLLSALDVDLSDEAPLAGMWRGSSGRLRLFCAGPDSWDDSVYDVYLGDYDWNGQDRVGHVSGRYSDRLYRFRWSWDLGPEKGIGYLDASESVLRGGWQIDVDATDEVFSYSPNSLMRACSNEWWFERVGARTRDGYGLKHRLYMHGI
jgi:hypothetical protein